MRGEGTARPKHSISAERLGYVRRKAEEMNRRPKENSPVFCFFAVFLPPPYMSVCDDSSNVLGIIVFEK